MQPGIIGDGFEQAAEDRFANGRRLVVQPLGPQLGQGLVVGESRHGLFQVGQAGGPALLLGQQCRHRGMRVDRQRLRAKQLLPQIQGPAPCAFHFRQLRGGPQPLAAGGLGLDLGQEARRTGAMGPAKGGVGLCGKEGHFCVAAEREGLLDDFHRFAAAINVDEGRDQRPRRQPRLRTKAFEPRRKNCSTSSVFLNHWAAMK